MKYRLLIALTTLTLFCESIVADVVKCTSPAGAVYYTDVGGCPSDSERETVRIDPAPTPPAENLFYEAEDSYPISDQDRVPQHLWDRTLKQVQGNQVAAQARDRAELNRIEQRLEELERKGKSLMEDLDFGSNIRRRWTREDLNEVSNEIAALKRKRQNLGYIDPPPRSGINRSKHRGTRMHDSLLVDGVPATAVGGGNYIDNGTGHFLQGTAGGVIDTQTGKFIPVH